MRIKACGDEMKAVESTIGAVMRERVAEAIRGPTRSHVGPIRSRERMDPAKDATAAFPTSDLER